MELRMEQYQIKIQKDYKMIKILITITLIFLSLSNLSSSDIDYSQTPTAIQINGKWTFARGGTIDRLLSKGYMIDPNNPTCLKPNPLHPRYDELIRNLKPKMVASTNFTPKSKNNSLTSVSFSGNVYRMEKDYVWILIDDIFIKLSKNNKTIETSIHRNLKSSAFDQYEYQKRK